MNKQTYENALYEGLFEALENNTVTFAEALYKRTFFHLETHIEDLVATARDEGYLAGQLSRNAEIENLQRDNDHLRAQLQQQRSSVLSRLFRFAIRHP